MKILRILVMIIASFTIGAQFLLAANLNLANLANKAFQEGLYDFAITQYQKILAAPETVSPDVLEEAQFYLGLSFTLSAQPIQATEALQQFLKQFPASAHSIEARYTLMLTLQEQKQFQQAFALGKETLTTFNAQYSQTPSSATEASVRGKAPALSSTMAQHLVKIMLAAAQALTTFSSDEATLRAFVTLLQTTTPVLLNALTAPAPNQSSAPRSPHSPYSPKGDILIIAGNLLTKIGAHDEAAERYAQALTEPLTLFEHEATQLTLIKSYLDHNRYEPAERLLTKALYATADESYRRELNFFLVHLAYLKGDYRKAIIGYKRYLDETLQAQENQPQENQPENQPQENQPNRALVAEPYTVEAILYLALAYQQTKQSVLAIKTLNRVLRNAALQDYHYRAHHLAYTLYELMEDNEALLETTEELLRLSSTDSERLTALEKSILFISRTGVTFDFVKDPNVLVENRLAEFVQLQQNKDHIADFYLKAATYHYQNNRFEQSFKLFSAGYTLTHAPKLILAAIEGRIEQNQFPPALKEALALEKILAATPKTAQKSPSTSATLAYLYDLIGFIYIKTNKGAKAAAYFKRNTTHTELGLKINAFFYLGEIARLAGMYDQAIQAYQEAETILTTASAEVPSHTSSSKLAVPDSSLSSESVDSSEDSKTSKASKTSNSAKPQSLSTDEYRTLLLKIYFQLGKIYEISLARPNEAFPHYQSALRQAQALADIPEQNTLHLILAQLYLSQENTNQAISQLEDVHDQEPESYYRALLKLASIYFNMGRYNKALANYIRIINVAENTTVSPPDKILEQAYQQRILVKVKTQAPREAYYYLGKMELKFPASPFLEEAYATIADFFAAKKERASAIKVYLESAAQAKRARNVSWEVSALFSAATTELAKRKKSNHALAYSRFYSVIEKSEAHRLYTPLYLEACFEAAVLNADKGDHALAASQFRKILNTHAIVSKAYPASRELSTSLAEQAAENLERISVFLEGSPYRTLKSIEAIKQKMQELTSPPLKAEGANLIIEKHLNANRTQQALTYLKYAQDLWPLPKSASVKVMQALINRKRYANLYPLALSYFLTEHFKSEPQYQEFLYYAAALSAARLNKDRDSTRFKKKLESQFPYSTYLKNLN